MNSIRSSGGVPSNVIGDFFDKARAIQGSVPRLAFLNRGQEWVVRKIATALPGIPPGPSHRLLDEMHKSHIANIAACDALLSALDDTAE